MRYATNDKCKTSKKTKKGFTLVELIVVIAILGLLAVIAIPRFSQYVKEAKWEKTNANAMAVYNAMVAVESDLMAEGILRGENAPEYMFPGYNEYHDKAMVEFLERVPKIIPSDIEIRDLKELDSHTEADNDKVFYIEYTGAVEPSNRPYGIITIVFAQSNWKNPETNEIQKLGAFFWYDGVYAKYGNPDIKPN